MGSAEDTDRYLTEITVYPSTGSESPWVFRGAEMAQWWERSPPTNVSWVRFQCVRVLRFSSLHKINISKFQFDHESERATLINFVLAGDILWKYCLLLLLLLVTPKTDEIKYHTVCINNCWRLIMKWLGWDMHIVFVILLMFGVCLDAITKRHTLLSKWNTKEY